MRPSTRARHLLAIALMAAAAAFVAYCAAFDERFSDDQVLAATGAIKHNQPDLLSHDLVFGPGNLWKFQSPAFGAILEIVLAPTGFGDPMLPFRVLAGLLFLVFLCGMYALLYRQTRSWSISLFVALMSCTVIHTPGGGVWGIGSLASIRPAALCTAFTPALVLMYLRYEKRRQLALVFFLAGVLGNFCLIGAANLVLLLILILLARRPLGKLTFAAVPLCLLVAAAGAFPYAWYCGLMRHNATPPNAAVAIGAMYQAIRIGDWDVLYPDLLRSLLNWLPLSGLLIIPAAAVLSRVERFTVRNLSFWVWFLLAALVVTFAFQGASQLLGMLPGVSSPPLGFVQASSLVMLPLYALFAQAVTNLFRILRDRRTLLRWCCVAFAVAWILPADNLRVLRFAVCDTVTMFMQESNRPRFLRKNHERHLERQKWANIADWARTHTDPNAVFLVDDITFRMLSQRSIVAAGEDVPTFYYFAPWRLDDWTRLLAGQRSLLNSTIQPTGSALNQFLGNLATRPEFRNVHEWYTIVRASGAWAPNDSMERIPGPTWGQTYQVYRLRPAPPTTTSSPTTSP